MAPSIPLRTLALTGLGLCACRGAAPLQEPREEEAVVQRNLGAMGTFFELSVAADARAAALQASEDALRALEAVEARLSTWRDDSELARLNRAEVGVPFALSAALGRDLLRARELSRVTDGRFDPGLGALVAAWGLRSGGRQPSAEELAAALAPHGLSAFELEPGQARRTHPAARIEEGGFGKGVGLDAAVAALSAAGVRWAVLDLGGQVALVGAPPEPVFGLAHPEDRERAVLELRIDHGSFATSAASERGIVVDGVRRAHVLDPRTGLPADDFGSVTVWAPDATTADALSTALYVMGPERGLAWAATHDGIEALVLRADAEGLQARATAGWRERVRVLGDVELTFHDVGEAAN